MGPGLIYSSYFSFPLRIRQATKKKKKFLKRSKKDDKKLALKELKALFQSDQTDGAKGPDSGSESDESLRGSPKPSSKLNQKN